MIEKMSVDCSQNSFFSHLLAFFWVEKYRGNCEQSKLLGKLQTYELTKMFIFLYLPQVTESTVQGWKCVLCEINLQWNANARFCIPTHSINVCYSLPRFSVEEQKNIWSPTKAITSKAENLFFLFEYANQWLPRTKGKFQRKKRLLAHSQLKEQTIDLLYHARFARNGYQWISCSMNWQHRADVLLTSSLRLNNE